MYLHPVQIGVLCNTTVMLITNKVFPDSIANAFTAQTDNPLSWDQIIDIMKGTRETLFCKEGWISYSGLVLFSIPAIPWYGTSYNGCDFDTFKQHNEWSLDNSLPKPPDCEPEGISPCSSFPKFGGAMIGTYVLCFPMTSLAMLSWAPNPDAVGVEGPSKAQTEQSS